MANEKKITMVCAPPIHIPAPPLAKKVVVLSEVVVGPMEDVMYVPFTGFGTVAMLPDSEIRMKFLKQPGLAGLVVVTLESSN